MNKESKLIPLVAQLRCCSARNSSVLRQSALETWDLLRGEKLIDNNRPTPAMMAALVINSIPVGQLLTMEERVKMSQLAELAVERYQEKISPPNKLGNALAGILKEY